MEVIAGRLKNVYSENNCSHYWYKRDVTPVTQLSYAPVESSLIAVVYLRCFYPPK